MAWRLGVIEYSVRITVTVLRNKLIKTPRLLYGLGKNPYPRTLPLLIQCAYLKHRHKIEPNANWMKQPFGNSIEKQPRFVPRDACDAIFILPVEGKAQFATDRMKLPARDL
jgi:hypothetical protein